MTRYLEFLAKSVAIIFFALLVTTPTALAQLPTGAGVSLELSQSLQREKGGTVVIATVENRSDVVAESVRLEVAINSSKLVVRGPYRLLPGQSRVEKLSDEGQLDGGYSIVYFTIGGVESSKSAILVQPAPAAGSFTFFAPLVPAILALAGVFLGALLAHSFSRRREGERSKFEWQKMLYERHEPAYLAFLAGWSPSTSVRILDEQFAKLRGDAYVSKEILQSFFALRQKLDSQGVEAEEKVDASNDFYDEVSNFIHSPWMIQKPER